MRWARVVRAVGRAMTQVDGRGSSPVTHGHEIREAVVMVYTHS